MSIKGIAGLANTMQGVNLLSYNMQSLKKKKKNVKGIVGLGVGNIVGASMIKNTGDIISKL